MKIIKFFLISYSILSKFLFKLQNFRIKHILTIFCLYEKDREISILVRDWYKTRKETFIREVLELAGKIRIIENMKNTNTNPKINELDRKESFLLNHFNKREVRIWRDHEDGLTFNDIASIYGFYDGSGVYKIWKNLNDFSIENFNK